MVYSMINSNTNRLVLAGRISLNNVYRKLDDIFTLDIIHLNTPLLELRKDFDEMVMERSKASVVEGP